MNKLELHYPTDNYRVNQGFGMCLGRSCKLYKELGMDGHNGIDVWAYTGQIVRAAHGGVVTFSGEDGSAGYGVVIRTHDRRVYKEGSAYFKTIYWHLKADSIFVKAGQNVKVGQIIAFANNTGMSTGPHLHFGLKPMLQGEQDWEWSNIEQDNGYYGAIDPDPYWSGLHAKTYMSIRTQLSQITLELASIINNYKNIKL